MTEILNWFTQMENTKPLALILFFVTFVSIIFYVYLDKKRSKRFEDYRYIPFNDENNSNK